jgi:hypothetical protein
MNKMERPLAPDSTTGRPENKGPIGSGKGGLVAAGAIFLLLGSVAIGVWQHYRVHARVMAAAQAQRDFVPTVATATVNTGDDRCIRAGKHLCKGERLYL